MRLSLFLFFSLFMLMPLFVVAQEAPRHRVVYLWDVTKSMHGYKKPGGTNKTVTVAQKDMEIEHYCKEYDIYDQVVEALIQYIKSYGDTTEIVVVPFNNIILTDCVWREKATSEGKKRLEERIRSFYNKKKTNTNIYNAFKYANQLFDGSKLPKAKNGSELYILTDGEHNATSKEQFYSMLSTWCTDIAEKYNVKGYYFLLTDQAIKDPKLRDVLERTCIEIIDYYKKHFFSIKGPQYLNLKENFGKAIQFNIIPKDVSRPIVGSEQIRIYASENPYISFKKSPITIGGKETFEIKPQYKHGLSELQRLMPTDSCAVVTLNFEQINKVRSSNELINGSFELRFVNKPQKTLTITIKK